MLKGEEFYESNDYQQVPNGVYITTLPTPGNFVESFFTSLKPGKKARVVLVKSSGSDLAYLKNLIEADKLRSIVEQTYPLSEVALAHSYSEKGHVVGKPVINVAS